MRNTRASTLRLAILMVLTRERSGIRRRAFNSNFTPEKYELMRREMTARCGMEVPFALCETPSFFPQALVERMGEDGKALIRQLGENHDYRAGSEASIPAKF